MLGNKTFSSYSVNDLKKAHEFYSKKLGLKTSLDDYMLHLFLDNGYEILLYLKENHNPADFTVLNFVVGDIIKTVDRLVSVGVVFERYDGDIETDERGIHRDEMAEIAWFKDPAGNILSIIQEK